MVNNFTKSQWMVISALGSANFFCAVSISLQAPFFPQEAEQKGSRASEYGLIFGVYDLVGFLTAPIFGKYIHIIGAKKTIFAGVIVTGCTAISFGLLDLVSGHVTFVSLAFLIRIVESFGASAAITACYCMTAIIFRDCVATTYAIMETCFGVGYMLGPTFGGVLYKAGGFTIPFAVLGCVLLLLGAFGCVYFPTIDTRIGDEEHKTVELLSVLKLPPVLLDLLTVTAAAISTGYFNATLEPHVRQFHLGPIVLGATFMIDPGIFAVTASLVGYMCDNRCHPKHVIMIGGLLIILGFSLIGPAPFIPVKPNLYLVYVGLILHGLGLSCTLIATFLDAIRSAVSYGYHNDMSLSGAVVGLIQSFFSLGNAIGPSVAGFLLDAVGFSYASLFVILAQTILVISMMTLVCYERHHPAITRELNAHACEISPDDCADDSEDMKLSPLDKEHNAYGSR